MTTKVVRYGFCMLGLKDKKKGKIPHWEKIELKAQNYTIYKHAS